MNIEIANRLVEMRKKSGLSQEQLADKLGLSRQAVSKWERAEASPDTDNLICLAKIYGVSLDSLLKTDDSVSDIVDEQVKGNEEAKPEAAASPADATIKETDKTVTQNYGDTVYIDGHTIRAKDGSSGDTVIINGTGLHIHSKHEDRNLTPEGRARRAKFKKAQAIASSFTVMGSVIAYCLTCFFYPELWASLWILFLSIPLVASFIEAIEKRKASNFAFPVLAVAAFFILGFYFNLWHPGWIVFLTIPAYYMILAPFEKNYDDDDDDDDDKEDEDGKKEAD